MRNAGTFAEILDAQLGCTDVPPAAVRAWRSRPLTAPLFTFALPLTAVPAEHVEPPLPARLTSLDVKALDDATTRKALRVAFRTLARRYHPDSHPGCSPDDRARLSRLFAEATDRYRILERNLSL
jgi:hypothetical protein